MLENLWNLYLWVATGFGLIVITLSILASMVFCIISTIDYIKKRGNKNGR